MTQDTPSRARAASAASPHLIAVSLAPPIHVQLDPGRPTRARIDASLHTYGVTTGFGAAATTRTHRVEALQLSIHTIPESLVRAAILIRANSLARGHSAVRIQLLDALISLLNLSITPIVPLRGTISASGDLAPLAYVAGAICGHPDVYVIDRSSEEPKIMSSQACLQAHGIAPLVLGPKEGLAVANGTAFSAAAASLAVFHAHLLATLAQALTAMSVEALLGQIGAFHPFIHQVARPHHGQVEVARNIFRLLRTSKLLNPADQLADQLDLEREKSKQILRQDRYPLRTSPQWIGPQLEDLLVAHQTIAKELNVTTDNPLVDVENGILHHGGNFQATSVALSMEKTRLAIAALGKIMFAQVTELNNSAMNNGLPSCLNGAEPSTNYHTKGLDTACAAYCSELQHLAAPLTTHVQSAEGHNQSINSLAFISARKTLEALEILKMLMASHLYCLCQALDLRVFEQRLKGRLPAVFGTTVGASFGGELGLAEQERLAGLLTEVFWERRQSTASLDSVARTKTGVEAGVWEVVRTLEARGRPLAGVSDWVRATEERIGACEAALRAEGLDHQTPAYLGGSRPLYLFVRAALAIPVRVGDVALGAHGPTVGGMVDRIFDALQFDTLPAPAPAQLVAVLRQMFPDPLLSNGAPS
ncbi:hypothetical protein PtA15_11A447 [Puccinia triticina]|uniref:Phenylalanine ammonia-lyase n=1 Tax=Puccinia triticina TaxID=208348 RepID=A0ABY7D081_9BASI|nr:uncharacterized protein PtA15_11A447 [Puccinia triticina]WAQ89756.1 hypothetical protein PtA15_11A447 [Puccinia triticina]WAR59803.1 hypothetical protein PtB15_11B444 [Puccinia triticina]